MKLIIPFLLILLTIPLVGQSEITNHFSIIVLEKTQDSGLKADSVARYTIRYVSSVSLQKENAGYVLEEPREGSGISYRGPIDRTVYWPDDFANVGDTISKTNIGGKVYLSANTPKPTESTDSILEKLKNRRERE